MRRICVFAGSSNGKRDVYVETARILGWELVTRQIGLVYGGASVGLMGVTADAVLAGGGEVFGVMPRGLFRNEVAHQRLTDLLLVESMHERKAMMASLSDGFIVLPGGYGTFDEAFEIITWAQIGIHRKPVGFLDVDGYFDPFFALVEHAIREGFIQPGQDALFVRDADPAGLIDRMRRHVPPGPTKPTVIPPEP
jgi:uncharacterized protein (TIGR00730 family)